MVKLTSNALIVASLQMLCMWKNLTLKVDHIKINNIYNERFSIWNEYQID